MTKITGIGPMAAGATKVLSLLPRQEARFVSEAAGIPSRISLRTLSRDKLSTHTIFLC